MLHCSSCGSELPDQAQFCGNCGHVVGAIAETPTNPGNFPGVNVLPRNALTTLSRPSQFVKQSGQSGQQAHLDVSRVPASQSQEVEHLPTTPLIDQKEEEDEERRRRVLLLPFPGLPENAPPSNIPMVQGTPQMGVPMVQGTPSMPGSPPSGQGFPPAPTAAAPLPFAPSLPFVPNSGSWGVPTQPHPVSFPHPTPTPTPHPHPSPGPSSGCAPRWFLIIAIIIIILSGIGGYFFFLPSPSLSGPTDVAPGDVLHLHGSGFLAGGSVSLLLDGETRVFSGNSGITEVPTQNRELSSSLMLAQQLQQPLDSNGVIPVNGSGNFDATITVDATWPLGSHTLHAAEQLIGIGVRGADLKFNIISQRAKLDVKTTTLDFGQLQMGTTATLSIVISNAGAQRLTWTVDTEGTEWLNVPTGSGAIDPGQHQQTINVTADTSQLSVGKYSAPLQINSNGGNAQVGVTLEVIPQSQTKQAKLDVGPGTLDYGTLAAGKQAVQVITISNVGTQALNWQADSGNTSWLTLDTTSGKILSGGVPRTVHVTVDTTNLAPQSYSATVSITSNGGKAQVQVTLVVAGSLTVSPTSFKANSDCSRTADNGWSCIASLSNSQSAQSNLDWSASGSGVNGISFSPSSGTLSPGQTTQVTITVPNTTCPASATFTFTGPANTVNVSWSCSAPPAATLSVSPSSINGNRDCKYGADSGWNCSVTLNNTSNQSSLDWSASSSGASFNPSQGTLSPGQTARVTVTVTTNTVCPTKIDLAFKGPANTVHVTWSCAAPTLSVSPTSLTAQDCPFSNGYYNCTVTVSDNEGGANWSASSDTKGVTFNPQKGTVYPASPTQVTVYIPRTPCPASVNLIFTETDSGKSITVVWKC